jgi:hypothetical protein
MGLEKVLKFYLLVAINNPKAINNLSLKVILVFIKKVVINNVNLL